MTGEAILRVEGTAITAADGPVLLRGFGLGGWMNMENFITGYAENAAVGNGHLEPGMAVLTKPFVMEALASRIKDLIAAP